MKTKKNWPSRKDNPENRQLAFNFALKYLSFRNRSVKEVFEYLQKKNFHEDSINYALKRLLDLKFLNDEEFARSWVESRQKHKARSKFVLKQELRMKGLKDDVIDPILKDANDDFETAKTLFEKKKKVLSKFSPLEFKKKMSGFLQRKGYSWEIISKLLKGD